MAPVSISSSENDNYVNKENQNNEETVDLITKDGTCRDEGNHKRKHCTESQDNNGELIDDEDTKDDGNLLQEKDGKSITIDENQAPDGGWGWFIVLGALLLRTVIGGIGRSHGLFYIQFKEKFNGTATETTLVTSLSVFLRLAAGPVVSILSGRFLCRTLTSIGGVVLFIGIILTGFGPSLHFLYFSYGILAGLGRALALTPVPIQLGYYFNKRRSLAFGLASAGFSIGGFAVTPIVELLFQHYGYQGTFVILSGFALNILVASALFRPIELHRKLTSQYRNGKGTENNLDKNTLIIKSLEQIESGAVLSSSTVSVNDVKALAGSNTITSLQPHTTSSVSLELSQNITKQSCTENQHKELNGKMDTTEGDSNHNADSDIEVKETLVSNTCEKKCTRINTSDGKFMEGNLLCCCKRKVENNNSSTTEDDKKKSKLISWSVLKDMRFLCFVFATFCFTLPSNLLFLPSLAKSKGVSDIQAATLLSVSAGCDTVFRVISGFVLDLKTFRSIRPLIYNVFTFMQAVTAVLFPLMTSYTEFLLLCIFEGAVLGIKNAQGSVIMIDMLGIDKLASSLAVTMSVRCIAIFLGPTLSGQLIDTYGNYNGAFYFGAGAIFVGALVMAIGNIVNHCKGVKAKKDSENSENNND